MTFTEKQLAQGQATATAVSVYSPTSGKTVIKNIWLSNTSTDDIECYFYHDDDGTTYNDSTNLCPGIKVRSKSFTQVQCYIVISSTGNFAVKCNKNGSLTYSLYGAEVT